MHLRPTTTTDIPSLATLVDAAYDRDELWNFLTPGRNQYPASWRAHLLKMLRVKLYKKNTICLVCVADQDDEGWAQEGEVLGGARWTRFAGKDEKKGAGGEGVGGAGDGDDGERGGDKGGVLSYVESWLTWAELRWVEKLRLDPATSFDRVKEFEKVVSESLSFVPVEGQTIWFLESLTVDPRFQRRGVGKMLVNWGLERAKEETRRRKESGSEVPVPAMLVGSAMGIHLYRSMGFRVIGWEDDTFMTEALVRADPAQGGSAMLWDPERYWIEDVGFEGQMRRGVVEAVWRKRDGEESK